MNKSVLRAVPWWGQRTIKLSLLFALAGILFGEAYAQTKVEVAIIVVQLGLAVASGFHG